MGSHPINLTLRFILELTALFSMGLWGWKYGEGFQRLLFAFGIPFIAAIVWAVFAVPNDPSRSGSAPVPTPGIIRLFIELLIFTTATWSFINSGFKILGWVFAIIVLLHYVISYDRIIWLLKR